MPRPHAEAEGIAASPITFDELYNRYASYVASIAWRLTGRECDVDDVVQDVFIICARKLGSIHSIEDAKPWLSTVVGRVARKHRRRRWLRSWLALDDAPVAFTREDRQADPEQQNLARRLYGFVAALPSEQRLVWELRHLEGETVPSIAAICGISEATVKRRLRAAQACLKGSCDAA